MKRAPQPQSRLAFRIQAVTLGGIALVTGAILLLAGVFVVRENHASLERQALSLAKLAGENGRFGIYTRNREELRKLAAALADDADVACVRFRGRRGELLAEWGDAHPARPVSIAARRAGTVTFLRGKQGDLDVVAVVPILPFEDDLLSDDLLSVAAKDPVGSVEVHLSGAPSQRALRGFLVRAGGMAVAVAALVFLLTLFVVRRIATPVRKLSSAAGRIAEGDLDVAVPDGATDEIGDLARSFRRMVENLARSRNEVESYREHLEEMVRDRTRALELATREAEEFAARAEEASRAKSQFLANVSHEIRTPMNGILGMTELLALGGPTPEQDRFIRVIRESAEALLRVINDVLDFSKIEAGRMELESVPFDPRRLVQGVSELFAPQARAKGLEFSATVAADVPVEFVGDSGRVRQILVNLMSNAVKFTNAGRVSLDVRATFPDRDHADLHLVVSDTGIGIPEDVRGRLFEAFTQADASFTRRFGGTGLGLVIARRLAEAMHGRIGIESREGEGTRFLVTLRLALPAIPGALAPPPTERERAQSTRNLVSEFADAIRGMRVLVADDTPTNQEVIRHVLDHLGCEVTLASDGEEAVRLSAEAEFDVVLMDCHMPTLDGYEATGRIRRREQAANAERMRIVALTASAAPGDRERCLACGMDDYITKPLQLPDLVRALRWREARPE